MSSLDPRQLEFDAALAEVVARADRPTDVNRLVAAAVRLRDAFTALGVNAEPAEPVEPVSLDVRTAELGILAAAAELAGGRASQNRVIEAHEALMAARTGATTADPAGHRWTLSDGPIGGVSLTLPLDEDDEPATVWLDPRGDGPLFPDQAGLTADQAARLASALAVAARAARGVEL